MRAADIEVGAQYVIREYHKAVRGYLTYHDFNSRPRRLPTFPAYWSRRKVTIVEKVGRRYVVEWIDQRALHQIPELPMRWTPRVNRTTVTPSQVVERVSE